MAARIGHDGRPVLAIERRLAHHMLRALGSPPVRIVLWNGEEIAASDALPAARVMFHDRATFWKVLLDPNLQFGEAYSDGRLDVEGDLVAFLETVYRAQVASGASASLLPAALLRRLHRARANTPVCRAREHPPPLRYRRGFLPAVARRGDGL